MKTCLVLSSLLLVAIASAGSATAPAPQAPEADQAAVEAVAVSLCAEAARSPFPQPPIQVQTCGCLRAPCLIGGNCCGDIPDPYCGKKLKGHNRYAGRCDVLGCEGVCCQN